MTRISYFGAILPIYVPALIQYNLYDNKQVWSCFVLTRYHLRLRRVIEHTWHCHMESHFTVTEVGARLSQSEVTVDRLGLID